MHGLIITVFSALWLLFTAMPVCALTINIPYKPEDPNNLKFDTIQEALEDRDNVSGDVTIILSGGPQDGFRISRTGAHSYGNPKLASVTITTEEGEKVTVEGSSSNGVIRISGGNGDVPVSLYNLHITGSAPDGIMGNVNSSIRLNNCSISGITGQAVEFASIDSLIIENNCEFSCNQKGTNGDAAVEILSSGSVSITDSAVMNNTAGSGTYHGCRISLADTVAISGSRFLGNHSNGLGISGVTSSTTVTDYRIEENGGIGLWGSNLAAASFSELTIKKTTATGSTFRIRTLCMEEIIPSFQSTGVKFPLTRTVVWSWTYGVSQPIPMTLPWT